MSIIEEVFKSENDTRRESIDGAETLRNNKEESNISKSKVENSELGLDKEIVEEKKVL